MVKFIQFVKSFWNAEEGQGMVEYGLILALIAVVVIGVVTLIGTNLNTKYGDINRALTPAP